jgi:hypothetical protein
MRTKIEHYPRAGKREGRGGVSDFMFYDPHISRISQHDTSDAPALYQCFPWVRADNRFSP